MHCAYASASIQLPYIDMASFMHCAYASASLQLPPGYLHALRARKRITSAARRLASCAARTQAHCSACAARRRVHSSSTCLPTIYIYIYISYIILYIYICIIYIYIYVCIYIYIYLLLSIFISRSRLLFHSHVCRATAWRQGIWLRWWHPCQGLYK